MDLWITCAEFVRNNCFFFVAFWKCVRNYFKLEALRARVCVCVPVYAIGKYVNDVVNYCKEEEKHSSKFTFKHDQPNEDRKTNNKLRLKSSVFGCHYKYIYIYRCMNDLFFFLFIFCFMHFVIHTHGWWTRTSLIFNLRVQFLRFHFNYVEIFTCFTNTYIYTVSLIYRMLTY